MLVEPESLCWLTGRMVAAHNGATSAQEFARYPALTAVVRDDGTGLGKGLKLERARRRAAHRGDIDDGLDVFHTFREGGRALRTTWGAATRRAGTCRRGATGVGPARPSGTIAHRPCDADEPAVASCRILVGSGRGRRDRLETGQVGVRVLHAGGPPKRSPPSRGGRSGGAAHLTGPAWAKTRRLLGRPESFTFLDQTHRQLAGLGMDPEVLSALLDLEGLRRQPWRLSGTTPESAATRGWAVARTVQLAKTRSDWCAQAGRVHQVLRGIWRASSLVECVNSVARMQRARHRKMTQGLLDLKRLYWNLRRFRTGRRKNQTPYDLLGLKLPDLSFWEFLKLTPEELRKQLSAMEDAP